MGNIIYSRFDPLKPVAVDLDKLTSISQSGWTMDYYLNTDEANGVYACMDWDWPDEELHEAITALVASWDREETYGGGVITYTKPEPKGLLA